MNREQKQKYEFDKLNRFLCDEAHSASCAIMDIVRQLEMAGEVGAGIECRIKVEIFVAIMVPFFASRTAPLFYGVPSKDVILESWMADFTKNNLKYIEDTCNKTMGMNFIDNEKLSNMYSDISTAIEKELSECDHEGRRIPPVYHGTLYFLVARFGQTIAADPNRYEARHPFGPLAMSGLVNTIQGMLIHILLNLPPT